MCVVNWPNCSIVQGATNQKSWTIFFLMGIGLVVFKTSVINEQEVPKICSSVMFMNCNELVWGFHVKKNSVKEQKFS